MGLPLGMGLYLDNLTVNVDVYNEQKSEVKEATKENIDEEEEPRSLFNKKKEKTVANNKCFLFYGPHGSGKQMMAHALAYETNSIFFSKEDFMDLWLDIFGF